MREPTAGGAERAALGAVGAWPICAWLAPKIDRDFPAHSPSGSIVVDLISSIDSSAVTLCTRTSEISAW